MLEDHGVIDWRDMLETISIPTLVCVGRYDRNAPVPAAEHVANSVPQGQLVIFEHSAHAPFYEEPEEFNGVLERFIERTLEATLGESLSDCPASSHAQSVCAEVEARGNRRTRRTRNPPWQRGCLTRFRSSRNHRELPVTVKPIVGSVVGLDLLSLHEILRSEQLVGPAVR